MAMKAKGNSPRHVEQEIAKVTRILDECRFMLWSDISASKLQAYLAGLRAGDKGIGPRTSNSYLIAFKAFCHWCVRDGRVHESPVQYLSGVNEEMDIRRKRRTLSADELRRLIRAAEEGETIRGMPGPERAMLYRVVMGTGLRWAELQSLKRSSFDLEGNPPTVMVDAAYSKHRSEDILPLPELTAQTLAEYFAQSPALPHVHAFPHMPQNRHGAKMVKADLAGATEDGEEKKLPAISYKDEAGRVADFHALRHSFVTLLADGGVHPKTAQDLARHSDINLTMNRYTHTLLEKKSEALAVLPDFDAPVEFQKARATGTDGDSCLVPCLAQHEQLDPIQDDSSRRSEGAIDRGADMKKGPANTSETQHSQGLNHMVIPGGIEPPFPDRKSGVLTAGRWGRMSRLL